MRRLIGCGQAMRRDDGAGLIVAERLRQPPLEGWEISVCRGDGVDLVERLIESREVVIVDAMRSGAAPGTIRRFEPLNEAIGGSEFAASTHALGVAEAIELAKILGNAPESIVVYGIEAGEIAVGEGLSEPVAEAVDRIVNAIREGRDPDA